MSLSIALKEKRTQRKAALDGANAILTKVTAEKREFTTEENAEFEKRHKEGDTLKVDIERIERQIEADREMNEVKPDSRRGGREDITGAENAAAEEKFTKMEPAKRAKLRKEALRKIILTGSTTTLTEDERAFQDYEESKVDSENKRALSLVTGSAGGVTIPTELATQLEVAEKAWGDLLNFVDTTTYQTDTGHPLTLPTMTDVANSGENLAENTTATSSQDPTFGSLTLGAYLVDSGIVLIPIMLLQDSGFDIETYIKAAAAERLGRRKNLLFTTGTGPTTQPTGLMTVTTLGVTAASSTAIAYSEILTLIHSIDPAYRPKAKFLFHDSTLLALKKLVDGNGRPLFLAGGTTEGINGAEPDRINGYPFGINQDMATIATGNKSMVFGDLSKYKVRTVKGMQFVRFQERFADKFQIGIMMYQRIDANLLDAGMHPVKHYIHP